MLFSQTDLFQITLYPIFFEVQPTRQSDYVKLMRLFSTSKETLTIYMPHFWKVHI